MLEQLGLGEGASRLKAAVRTTLAGGVRTRDLGGTATTREVAQAVAEAI
jgi:tartrate dehydrogenase/decarboxylase/D-malate dehydrogenase